MDIRFDSASPNLQVDKISCSDDLKAFSSSQLNKGMRRRPKIKWIWKRRVKIKLMRIRSPVDVKALEVLSASSQTDVKSVEERKKQYSSQANELMKDAVRLQNSMQRLEDELCACRLELKYRYAPFANKQMPFSLSTSHVCNT